MSSVIPMPVTCREHLPQTPVLSFELQEIIQRRIDGLKTGSGVIHHYDAHSATLVSLWVEYGEAQKWSVQGPCDYAEAMLAVDSFAIPTR